MAQLGWALVNLSDGSVVGRYALTGNGTRLRVPHNDGGFTWELPGWSDKALAIVPIVRADIVAGELESAQDQPAVFDGAEVVVHVTLSPFSSADAALAIDDEAGRVILSRYPEWKQRNMIAKGVELAYKVATNSATADEMQQIGQLQAVWAWIEAVRARSDALQAAYAAGSSVSPSEGSINGSGSWES